MPKGAYLLAIDQGTTSSRAIVFDAALKPLGTGQREFRQIFPADGWVEHDADEIWDSVRAVCREALRAAGIDAAALAGIGITNQRETTVLWERAAGRPVANAIVWQDRRTAAHCQRLKDQGHEAMVRDKTGLVLDPYFSATKLAWLLDNAPDARRRAEKGELAFGTVDSFLLWRLTGGKAHATDATNASRTLLFDIGRQQWDDDLLGLFGVPRAVLPRVLDSAALFGVAQASILGAAVPVLGIAGDQQAAAIGQACFQPGAVKSTYGTGCFVLVNTGERIVPSRHGLIATVAYRLGGRATYAIEGSIFNAGSAVKWLRDDLGLIRDAAETETLARSIADTGGVYLVPAFTGMGAPWWDPQARGALLGLARDSGVAQIARAALEAACYQTCDLIAAVREDGMGELKGLRVDGGMAVNDWAMQFLADMLDLPVERPVVTETTALGAASLAGLQAGIFASPDEVAAAWRQGRRFEPAMDGAARERLLKGWRTAVGRVLSARAR
ncbi:MAG: glycerol kinase GlpK [Alphaproteobacteria bacterium]|nr:glycerol kinase GlpK [Alphaproteobacteria bacterium]